MAVTEYSRHGFCELLPPETRAQIEMMAPEFLPETWPVRFVALISMLEDIAAKVAEDDQPFVVNNWVIIVTGLLEHLPRDLRSPECLALMRHSPLERFRQTAVRNTPDTEQQAAFLRREYPQWTVVEDLLRDYETWAAKQSLSKPH
ncbi:hypothetical protein DXM27_24585 [Rhizobium rhizogenes]|uniref:Uncharacterized protein n=1 Tax=Rhizobium rhizogenes TaxID=359 RepID=A0AA88JQG8_RHIRH|nr:hypothetical protein [Rhizobium rhizogenes]KAA3497927.1 hypothetical protein DXM27_24585 [Rhizobium rhizogenes]KAA3521738.1 hypothetical protein DXM29_23705 [Agrobacterium tumefaciens]